MSVSASYLKSRNAMYHGKSMQLGGGGRFAKVAAAAAKSGATNPAAVAAAAGRKKYGKKKMAAMATAGKQRAATKRHKQTGPTKQKDGAPHRRKKAVKEVRGEMPMAMPGMMSQPETEWSVHHRGTGIPSRQKLDRLFGTA